MARFGAKRCVVTGAGSGLGREIVLRLAAEGARLAVLDRNADALASLEAEAEIALSRAIDVADGPAIADFADAVRQAFGGLDILVNAAGMLGPAVSVADCPEDEWDRVFDVNVKGSYLTARHLLPLMRAAGGGSIVNFSSTAGLAGSATLGPYSATKGAVVLMTRSLALAHAHEGIRVNAVCPGSIETPMLEATFASAGSEAAAEARRTAFRQRHPLGRFGTAAEVAEAALFLASDAAGFVTGVAFPVDGGRLA